jgi:hypothetical protein
MVTNVEKKKKLNDRKSQKKPLQDGNMRTLDNMQIYTIASSNPRSNAKMYVVPESDGTVSLIMEKRTQLYIRVSREVLLNVLTEIVEKYPVIAPKTFDETLTETVGERSA